MTFSNKPKSGFPTKIHLERDTEYCVGNALAKIQSERFCKREGRYYYLGITRSQKKKKKKKKKKRSKYVLAEMETFLFLFLIVAVNYKQRIFEVPYAWLLARGIR